MVRLSNVSYIIYLYYNVIRSSVTNCVIPVSGRGRSAWIARGALRLQKIKRFCLNIQSIGAQFSFACFTINVNKKYWNIDGEKSFDIVFSLLFHTSVIYIYILVHHYRVIKYSRLFSQRKVIFILDFENRGVNGGSKSFTRCTIQREDVVGRGFLTSYPKSCEKLWKNCGGKTRWN